MMIRGGVDYSKKAQEEAEWKLKKTLVKITSRLTFQKEKKDADTTKTKKRDSLFKRNEDERVVMKDMFWGFG